MKLGKTISFHLNTDLITEGEIVQGKQKINGHLVFITMSAKAHKDLNLIKNK